MAGMDGEAAVFVPAGVLQRVEVAGIEPASSSDEPGLLRAQLARRSLGSCTRASALQTSPDSVHFPAKP